jgi:hypothetical protein
MKRVKLSNLKKGQLLQVKNDQTDLVQFYCDGHIARSNVRDLIAELGPGQIVMFLKEEWQEDVEVSLFFLIGKRIYTKRFCGSTKKATQVAVDKFLSKMHNPME